MKRDQTAGEALATMLKERPWLSVNGEVSAVVEESDPLEHAEQCAVIDWARAHEDVWPELGLLYAIPNGGYRHPATARAKTSSGTAKRAPHAAQSTGRIDR